MPGRPRKPLEVKLLEGSYRADRDGPADGVQATGVPVPPEDLSPEARGFWDAVVPRLVETGVARAVDTPALVQMAFWYSQWKRLAAELDKQKPTARGYHGLMMKCGLAGINLDKLAARFGLTPADRAKLRADLAPDRPRVRTRDRHAGTAPAS